MTDDNLTPVETEALRKVSRQRRPARKSRDALLTERLITDERVVASANVSNGIFWKPVAVFIASLLVGIFVAIQLGVLLAVVSVLMAIYAILRKEIIMLVVTNKRILVRYGLLQVDVVDMHFDKVESVELARMITGYLMGYSTVIIMGTGNRYMALPYIENAVEIRRAFNELSLNVREATPTPVVIVNDTSK